MNVICLAVVRHLSGYPFWTDEAKAGILADAGQKALGDIQVAHKFAYDQVDLWLGRPYSEAWQEVQRRLLAQYPWLNVEAAECIATLAKYDWK